MEGRKKPQPRTDFITETVRMVADEIAAMKALDVKLKGDHRKDQNMNLGLTVPYADQGGSGPKMLQMPTMKDRLADAVKSAEARLADAQRAKEIFDAHPELEELINIMQRGHF